MKRVIVIGAGVGGLAAAIDLQTAGFEVELYEKLSQPGGKMHQISLGEFKFDVGPSLVMMPDIFNEIYSKAGKNPKDYIEMERLDPIMSVYYHDDMHVRLDVSSELSKLIPMLESISEKDTHGFLKYLESIYGRYLNAKDNFILKSFNEKKDFWNIKTMIDALKLKTFNNASDSIAKYVKNKYISQMLAFQTLYIGVSPNNGPSLYTIIPMIELLYGVFYLKGGMHSMAEGMAKLLTDIGGKIHYDSPVEEIVIQNQEARGIKVHGEIINSDFVVCNADFPYAMKNLVKDISAKGKYTDAKIDKMKYSCSCFVLYLATNRKYNNIETHNFIIANDLDKNLTSIFNGDLIEDPSFYVYIASHQDSTMAPEGKDGLYILIPVSELSISKYEWTEETMQYYKDKVFNKLEKHSSFETIREDIIDETYFAPMDFEEQFHAHHGACFGLQPILSQSSQFRPQSKAANCKNLYFCGSSTHPGAGVPIAITSGHLASQSLIKDFEHEK